MAKYMVSLRLSRDIVNLLIDRGMTVTGIAEMLGVTKSYISRVKNGKRKFTLDHMSTLEKKLKVSLLVLLMQSIPRESVSPALRPLYDETLRMLKITGSGREYAGRGLPQKRRTKAA